MFGINKMQLSFVYFVLWYRKCKSTHIWGTFVYLLSRDKCKNIISVLSIPSSAQSDQFPLQPCGNYLTWPLK